ncbi:RHS repeat domain-containing protein [Pseudoalteromonas ostreae]|uniref:RHS repeat domain-containing protein n=1 Tax=Pseudoalteromonas ostreae TaxID=2774154 RepID=UPI001E596B3D|nr:RHS repeat-associated core domain-containing protein [Pseudoalteromonas ostreae]
MENGSTQLQQIVKELIMNCIRKSNLILFTLLFINQYSIASEKDYQGSKDIYSKTVQQQSTGEIINYLSGKLSYETVDAVIPGSRGMDIIISRSHNLNERVLGYQATVGSMVNWHFEIPRIVIPTTPWGITSGWQPEEFDNIIDVTRTTRTGICNDPYPGDGRASQKNTGMPIAKKYWAGMQLKIPGQPAQNLLKNTDTSSRYPANTKWVTTSDWVVSCTSNGEGFIVKSPQGITYTMDVMRAFYNYTGLLYQWNEPGNNTLFASKIEDLHNNKITYSYETGNGFYEIRDRNGYLRTKYKLPVYSTKLTKITRNDAAGEQIVNFDYKDSAGFGGSIDTISINGREWNYKYKLDDHVGKLEHYLEEVINPDGTTWKYKYEGEKSYRDEDPGIVPQFEGPNLLTQVKLPSGGTIDYAYKVFNKLKNDPYDTNIRLHTRLTKNAVKTVDNWVFNYQNHSNNTVKVTVTKGLDSESHIYKNDKSFQHGQLISQEFKRNTDSKKINYTYEKLAEIGEFTFLDYPKDIPDSLTTKVKLVKKEIIQDGNTYTTDYLEHDIYGKPKKIKEVFAGKTKFTKLSYYNNLSNWLIGLPKITSVSETDVDEKYQVVSEISYHNAYTSAGLYNNLGLPYEQKSFGVWKKRFTKYTDHGELERVEFNSLKTAGVGNRFIEYKDYNRGQPQLITVPSRYKGTTISMSQAVDNNGWIKSSTDYNDVTTHYLYDAQGNIKSIDLENDTGDTKSWADTLYTWATNANGTLTRTVQSCELSDDGETCAGDVRFTQTETYDGLLRLTSLSKSDGANTYYQSYGYDKNNQQICSSYWSDSLSSCNSQTKGINKTFDFINRLTTISTSGLGTVNYKYLAGNKIQLTDAEHNTTTTKYQAFGSPSYERAIDIKSPESVTTTIEIDVFGLTHSIAQQGLTKAGAFKTITENRYYDDYKQLCLTTRPDVGNTLYKHNALGKLVWSKAGVTNTKCSATQPALSTSFSYDNLGELQTINYPDNSGDVTYERDNNGNVKTLTAGNVIHRYEYNNQNLLEEEQLYIDTQLPLTLKYTYNDLQQRSMISYPDGTVVNFKPNSFGEPTEAQTYNGTIVALSFAKSATYYANGLLNSFTYGNGVKHETTIHSDSLLPKQLKDTGPSGSNLPSTVMSLTYDYDNNANVTSINDGQNSAYSLTDLQYDGLDRLTSTTGGSGIGSSSLRYDGFGNITYYKNKGKTLNYTYDYAKNRLSKVTGVSGRYGSIRYDGRGNIEYNGVYSLDFNAANQLTTAKGNSYLYDGHNRRVKQTDASGTSYSMYSQDGMLLYREKGSTITGNGTNYIYLGKKLIAKYGNVTPQSVDKSRQHSRPFGETIEAPKDDVGYTGHKFDTDLGLSYMQARYYDPVIGRFYSNDPIGFRDVHSFNRYAYANNNPYKYVDPTGQYVESAWDAASLSVGLYSLGNNLWNGNFGAAGIDALGVAADGVALALPIVPGGAGMAISASRQGAEAVSKYEVGAFNDLSKRSAVGDKLDIHHAAQKHPASQVIDGYDPKTAPSIAVPAREHRRIPTIKGGYEGNARGLLAKDIKDLRQHTNAPNSALQNLIRLNKESYPSAFIKGK